MLNAFDPFIVLSMKLHANAKLQSDESNKVFNAKNMNKLLFGQSFERYSTQLLTISIKFRCNFSFCRAHLSCN